MSIPDVSSICVEIIPPSQDVSVTFPGGAQLSVQMAQSGIPDPMEISKQMMAQTNAALTPLVPLMNVIDVVIALINAMKAIPDALGPPPDPSKLTSSLDELTKKSANLLKLVPQLSIPLLVVGLIDVLLQFLDGMCGQLRLIIKEQEKILKLSEEAKATGNMQLQVVVDCSNKNISAQMQNLNESVRPVSRFIALINLFMQLAGLPSLPDLANLGPDAQAALASIEDIVNTLKQIRTAIPA